YLMVGRLTDYKRVDLAIEAFNQSGRPLRIIGDGPFRRSLQQQARSNVQFLGRLSDEDIRHHYARGRALIFPGCEDFGIVPVEAQAFGHPVIAYGNGGALDTVIPYQPGITPAEFATGILFPSQTAGHLNAALDEFERQEANFRPEFIQAHALRFRTEEFKRRLSEYLLARLQERNLPDRSSLRSEVAA
ncbi:MAG: glycosyltransferase, partial [Terriglobales bacterium]